MKLFRWPFERNKAFSKKCLITKHKEYKDLLMRYGLNNVKIWINTLEGKDYAMFIHDMNEDAPKRLKDWATSTHPFDQWFDKQLRDCYDFEGLAHAPPQPIFWGELDGHES